MNLSDSQAEYIEEHHTAAMITVGQDGRAKAVRVGVVVVDGRLWSSGTRARVRTDRLRRDPRCTLFVFGTGYEALTLETRVEILDGADAPEKSLQLFRVMQDRPEGPLMWFGQQLDVDAFLRRMTEEGRLIYQFGIEKAYGVS